MKPRLDGFVALCRYNPGWPGHQRVFDTPCPSHGSSAKWPIGREAALLRAASVSQCSSSPSGGMTARSFDTV
jgi:hypothetical protein